MLRTRTVVRTYSPAEVHEVVAKAAKTGRGSGAAAFTTARMQLDLVLAHAMATLTGIDESERCRLGAEWVAGPGSGVHVSIVASTPDDAGDVTRSAP